MEYYIRGKNKITLSQNDFIAKGGQGQIFGKGNTVYKVYLDPLNIIPDGKVRELKILSHPNIIIPKDTILDKNSNRIGLTMDWIKNTTPLCKLFTNDFRSRNGITNDLIIILVDNIRCLIEYTHRKNCLVIDGNEFNYITNNKDFSDVYSIDTDSYQTATYPATAIMPSIKDYHNDEFSKITDWFSFAIIACQLFLGMHPFKGKHPKYNSSELEKRMLDNISIFNKDTILPRIVRDFSLIPKNYYDWFIALFEKGQRAEAPAIAGALNIIMAQIKTSVVQGNINISLIKEYNNEILYHCSNAVEVVKTTSTIFIDNKSYPVTLNEELVLTSKKNIPIICNIKDKKFVFRNLLDKDAKISIDIVCTNKMIIGNAIYLKNEGNLIELVFNDMGHKVIASIKNVWNIMPNSSMFFSNVIYQNVLGKAYLVIPLPSNNLSKCIYSKIDILDDYKIIDAKYDKKVCCLIGFKNNQYDKIILRFDDSHTNYDIKIIENISYMEINFIVKDNGVVVMVVDENNIDIFRNIPFDKDVNRIDNITLPLPLKLSYDGNSVLFFKGRKLNRIHLSN